jgi:hypothetical protein
MRQVRAHRAAAAATRMACTLAMQRVVWRAAVASAAAGAAAVAAAAPLRCVGVSPQPVAAAEAASEQQQQQQQPAGVRCAGGAATVTRRELDAIARRLERIAAASAAVSESLLAAERENVRLRQQIEVIERSGTARPLTQLLRRQHERCPEILLELEQYQRKVGHWAWWVFPTEIAGRSEPPPSTFVTADSAEDLLALAPREWREALETICALSEEHGFSNVVPSIDHGRVEHFLLFWERLEPPPPPWLRAVLGRLRAVAGLSSQSSKPPPTGWVGGGVVGEAFRRWF